MMPPEPLVTEAEAAEFTRLFEDSAIDSEYEAFFAWCKAHSGQLSRIVSAWAAFEFLGRQAIISELMHWSTPGYFGLEIRHASDAEGFDIESMEDKGIEAEDLAGLILLTAAKIREAEAIENAVIDVDAMDPRIPEENHSA
jgi:hypothetical protein